MLSYLEGVEALHLAHEYGPYQALPEADRHRVLRQQLLITHTDVVLRDLNRHDDIIGYVLSEGFTRVEAFLLLLIKV